MSHQEFGRKKLTVLSSLCAEIIYSMDYIQFLKKTNNITNASDGLYPKNIRNLHFHKSIHTYMLTSTIYRYVCSKEYISVIEGTAPPPPPASSKHLPTQPLPACSVRQSGRSSILQTEQGEVVTAPPLCLPNICPPNLSPLALSDSQVVGMS